MKPTEEELTQLELGIADLERRVSETTSRVSFQPGAFGSIEVLHFMEQTLEELRKRRHLVRKQLHLAPDTGKLPHNVRNLSDWTLAIA